jgi:NADPH:quinone reductase-like Zn-dependent oxidoreductase
MEAEMLALTVAAAGAAPTLSEVPVPEVGAGNVLVRVEAAGLNPVDNAIAAGVMAGMIPHEYPLVLGRDAAGTVTAVGEGVTHVAVGDEVLGHVLLAPPVQAGTLAEYAVLPAATVVRKPAELSFARAAALPLAAAAASAVVDAVDPRPGHRVLVVGASGGVGSYAIQLLAARGATVIATGGPAAADRLTGLGASSVVDYRAAPVADQVRAAYPDGVDALIDLVAATADRLPLAAVRAGGAVASPVGAATGDSLAKAGVTGTNVMANAVHDTVAPLVQQAAAGTLKVHVAQVLPLEKATDGLAAIASGQAHGKLVVHIAHR